MTRALIVAAVSTKEQAHEDKVSLKQQEADGVMFAEREGWDVISIVRIPGFSRRFYTLAELVEHASAKGVEGPSILQRHIQQKDFDVLWVRSTNRFGREQSINAEVINRVIKECRARIYSQLDGWIDKGNRRAMAAITGYRDSAEIDELTKKHGDGILKLASRGLPVSAHTPLSHRLIRSKRSGEMLRVEVREELRPLFNDMASLIIEGVPYDRLPEELYKRFGYVDERGKPYSKRRIWRTLMSPVFWGNNMVRSYEIVQSHHALGTWVLDASEPPPHGVTMFYDVTPAVYSGEQAQTVKAELRRRASRYSIREYETGTFTGLCYCANCYHRMTYQRVKNRGRRYNYIVCNAKRLYACPNLARIPESAVLEFIRLDVEETIRNGVFKPARKSPVQSRVSLKPLERAKAKLQAQYDALFEELSLADDDLKEDFRQRIRAKKDELMRCQAQIAEAERASHISAQQQIQQKGAVERFQNVGWDGFLKFSPLERNQLLHRLLGNMRIIINGRAAVAYIDISQINR